MLSDIFTVQLPVSYFGARACLHVTAPTCPQADPPR